LIDVTDPESPGWWMQTLWRQLSAEQPRLKRLEQYRRGEPDIVMGTERLKSAFFRFQNMSRSNFAELIIAARTNRMAARAIRTSASNDDNGDQAAWRIWTANGMDVWQTDLYRSMCTFGAGYVAVGSPLADGEEPVITVEDPRQTITAQDALRPSITVAAFKIYHDPQAQMDYAVLWLPGQKWVAQRPRKARAATGVNAGQPIPVNFSPASFDLLPVGTGNGETITWADQQPDGALDPTILGDGYDGITSETYDLQSVPVVKYGNRDGVGVFELHTDLLDRIAHVTLQQMVIATLQAFKQRAIQPDAAAGEDGGLPDEDEDGNPIDYNEVFEADPGALWRLPVGAKIWESGQVDLSGILNASKDWVLHLAACTQTPFPMFSPDSANQSANGASLYREGLTFNVEDLCRIAGAGHSQVISLAFQLKGDTQRGSSADVIVDWAPADRYSILEMAQADAQSSLPLAQKCARIYGMSPAEVKITVAQATQQAFMVAALQPTPAPADPAPAAPSASDSPAA
jgi:hypothetical protein